jgi:hypothetical protein
MSGWRLSGSGFMSQSGRALGVALSHAEDAEVKWKRRPPFVSSGASLKGRRGLG